MAIQDIRKRVEDIELITNYDLVTAAHALMDGIDLDVASSKTVSYTHLTLPTNREV